MAAALQNAEVLQTSPLSRRAERYTYCPLGSGESDTLWACGAAAVGLYHAIVTSRKQWIIRGLVRLSGVSVAAALAATVPMSVEEIRECLAKLCESGWLVVDEQRKLIYAPDQQSLTAQAPQNPWQADQLAKQVAELPDCPLVRRATADLLARTEEAEPARKVRRGRRSVDATLLERVRAALGVRLVAVPEPEDLRGQRTLPGMAVMEVTPDFIDYEQACEPAAHLREGAPSQSVAKRAGGAPLSILTGGQDDRRGSDLGATDGTSNAASAPGPCAADPGAARVGQRRDGASLRLVGDVGADAGVRAPAAALPTFGARWRSVAKRCPALAGASRRTDTGLSHWQEAKLVKDCRDHALTDEDLLLVADYVKAGGFGWAGPGARERVVSDIVEALAQARQWDSEGRGPAIGKNKGRAPQNLKPSQGW